MSSFGVVSGGKRPFRPDIDISLLQRRIRETGNVKLLIIDPLVSAVLGDSHKNADVRQSLQPLVDLAAEEGVAVLGISHFSKATKGREPLERVTGSLAFGALARIVMVCSKQTETDARVFCRAKSNIGADNGGFEYLVLQSALPGNNTIVNSHVQWGKPVEGDARNILATAESSDDRSDALDEAKDFLREILKTGRMDAKTIQTQANDAGISEITLRRARIDLGLKISREGFGKCKFFWDLPSVG